MEKSCSITYGEALEKGFQIIDIEGIVSLCPIYGSSLAKPMNLILNTIALRSERDKLDVQYLTADDDLKNMDITKEEYDAIKSEYRPLRNLLDIMINLNSKGYDPNEMLSGTALDTVISALEGLSNVGSTLSGLAGISKSKIKNAIGIDHTVRGSNENDLLTGCSHGGDTLIGGDGNDTLNHASGQEEDSRSDSLYGGNGFDTYFAGDWDYVNDSDGRGKVS